MVLNSLNYSLKIPIGRFFSVDIYYLCIQIGVKYEEDRLSCNHVGYCPGKLHRAAKSVFEAGQGSD
jgi:hypothetical protein